EESGSKEHYCVAGFFYFQILIWVLLRSETFLGEISGLSRRRSWSAVFSSCRMAALQACETSRVGPPSPIRDQGSFCAQFRRTQRFHDLRTVPLSDRFVLTKA